MEIDTRHLRLVKAVADSGSISGAAPGLGTTQPALTRQLRRIEAELGAELFVRSRDGVEATELGRLVAGRADAVLSVIDSLQADVAEATQSARPAQVRIGVRSGPALLGLMRGLRELWPDVEILIESESRTGGLLDLLAAGHLDVAVIQEFEGHEVALDQRVLSTLIDVEPVLLALADDHPLATREVIELDDLQLESWLLSPLDVDREADCISSACARAGFAPDIAHYVDETLGSELVRVGEAISHSLPRTPPEGTTLRPLAGAPIRVNHLLLLDRHHPLVDHVDKLAAFVTDAIGSARDRYEASAN